MSKPIVHASDLTEREKRLLFWASFLSLAAAGFGFSFRVAMQGTYGAALELTQQQVGEVFGASLWPIAITMIGFSLIVDRTGYKLPMYGAFALQALSGVGTFFAESYGALYLFALCAGLGHGIVEAVINPICAAVYPREKAKRLTILHAAWPAGLVGGTLLILGVQTVTGGVAWQVHALWILLPAAAYALMYLPCKFPVDERVQAGVPYMDMLKQVGFLTAALTSTLVVYVVGDQLHLLTDWTKPDNWFEVSMMIGGGVGLVFGLLVRSVGRPLFFLLCLLMIPVATAELGTDGWIQGLMQPVLHDLGVPAAMALVFSASIMLALRVFAGGIFDHVSPPTLMCVSGVFSAIGLFWLSSAAGMAIFVAFFLYAMGQTYYWPCILGFTSERYPQGGALTLNTVSAIGLLSAGVIGTPILGAAFDTSIHEKVVAEAPALAQSASLEESFLWMHHEKIDPKAAKAWIDARPAAEQESLRALYNQGEPLGSANEGAGRDVLRYATRFPGLLFVVFLVIALWFKMRGGYKPIHLDTHGTA